MAKPDDKSTAPTVYVVDDDDGMRRALDTLLSTVGYKTAVFSRPSEFLANFKIDSPGCLVLDIRMPDMSGLELQQHLNRIGSMLPVIFITGHGDVPMAVQAMKEGAFEFVQKPFRDQDLLDRINHALKQDAENRNTVARRAEVLHRLAAAVHQVEDHEGGAKAVCRERERVRRRVSRRPLHLGSGQGRDRRSHRDRAAVRLFVLVRERRYAGA